jgi:glutaredoxin
MLKEFLNEHNISYQDIDVGKDRNGLIEMKEKSGQLGVPVIDIDGKIIVGFDRDTIARELGVPAAAR